MKDHLNEVFKNANDNFEMKVDPALIWEGIETKMGEPKKKRFAWFWLFGFSFLILSLVGTYLMMTNSNAQDNNSAISTNDLIATEQLKSNNSPQQNHIQSIENTSIIEQNVIKPNLESKVSQNEKVADLKNIDSNSLTSSFEKNQQDKYPLIQNKLSENLSPSPNHFDENNNPTILTPHIVIQNNANENSSSLEFDKSIPSKETTLKKVRKTIDPLTLVSINSLNYKTQKIVLSTTIEEPQLIKPVDSKRFMFSSFQMQGSFGYFSKSYQNTSSDFGDYATLRDNTERTLEYWSYGMTIGLFRKSNLEIYTGFRHTRLNEEFKWKGSYLESEEGTYPTGITINSEGDTIITQTFEGEVTSTIDRDMVIYNAYKLFDIPIGVRYISKSGFLAEAEYLWNISLKSTGFVLDERSIPISNAQNPFKSKISGSTRLGLGYSKSILSNCELRCLGELHYIPNSFNDAALPIQTNRILYGLNLGLNYRLY